MVCLDHADSVCETCDISQCTIYYSYTLEELEELRVALETRLNAYENWRQDFATLFLGPHPASAIQAMKAEAGEEKKARPQVDIETFEVRRLFGLELSRTLED